MSEAQQYPPDTPPYQHRAIVQPDRDWLSVLGAVSSLLVTLAVIVFGVWYFISDHGAAVVTEESRISQIENALTESAKEETAYRTEHEEKIKERRGQIEAAQGSTNQRLDGLEGSSRSQSELIDRLSYRMASQEAKSEQLGTTLAKISEALADQRTDSARQSAEISGQIDGLRQIIERIERQAVEVPRLPSSQKPTR